MAKLIDLFTFSGRIGDLVSCKGPGGHYLRSRPRKSSKVPTARQLEVRARFALAVDFITPLRRIVYLGFGDGQRRVYKTGAMGRAISHAARRAVEGSYPDLVINPADILLSRGDVQPLKQPVMTLQPDGQLRVGWDGVFNRSSAFGDDRVFVLAYRYPAGTLVLAEALRSSGGLSLDLSAEPTGSEWLVYACAAERNLLRFADSQFLGRVVR